METVCPEKSLSQGFPNQLVYTLPKRLGSGSVKAETFPSGLIFLHTDLKPTQPIRLVSEISDWNFGVGFNLTGHSEIRSSEGHVSAKSGISGHYAYPGLQKITEDIGATYKSKISILFDTKTLLDLANEDEEPFLPFLKGLQNEVPVTGQEKIAPELRNSLRQLITCQYTGKTRTLFIEGKMMEIFAHKLEELRTKGKGIPRQPRIIASDIERIHYAAELLVRDPVNPPDLTEIAGQIGMCRSKFYHHFKIVFEHSPMDHLRKHRLQVAWQLLQQGDHNITEVAFAVGFNSLSYFTRTFIAEFGFSPRQII